MKRKFHTPEQIVKKLRQADAVIASGCAPTNVQAEVLVPDPILLDDITAIAVADEEQGKREICRASLQGLSIDKDILVVPDFYHRTRLARTIQSGNRVNEIIFDNGGHHGQ